MARPGEWINFEELCRRVPTKSPRTLRRYIAQGMISKRQARKGGVIDFNWHTVQRDLALMETPGLSAERAPLIPMPAEDNASLAEQVAALTQKVDQLLALVGERKAS